MTFRRPTCQLERRDPGAVDDWGNPARAWLPPVPLPIDEAAPASSDLVEEHREADRIEWTLYCPSGTRVDALDRVLVDGEPFEVAGCSGEWGLGAVVELRKIRG